MNDYVCIYGPQPICMDCKHLHPEDPEIEGVRCIAFPDGIPMVFWGNLIEHRKPYPGDHGIQFEPKEGLPNENE